MSVWQCSLSACKVSRQADLKVRLYVRAADCLLPAACCPLPTAY